MARTAQKVEEKVTEDTKVSVDNIKETTKKDTKEPSVEELYKIIAGLQAQVEALNTKKTEEMFEKKEIKLNDEVTIVCTTFCEIQAIFPTWRFNLSRYGQKYTITRAQFQELYNSKPGWFKKRYIALDSKHMDYALEIECPVYNEGVSHEEGVISPADIKKFGSLRGAELEKYYDGLSKYTKNNFASYFMSKCYEKDPDFYDVDKMNTMNRLTGGRLFDNLIMACQSSLNRR